MITPSFALTATERVLPRLALDFTTANLDSRVTFTRTGNTATVVNSSGIVQNALANTPRFDFDPVTLTCKGLLIEEARTNILLQSEDFLTTWSISSGLVRTANTEDAPDGNATADTIASNGTNTFANISQAVTASGTVAVSFFVKQDSGDTVFLRLLNGTDIGGAGQTQAVYRFNFSTAAWTRVIGGTATTASVQAFDNGWYRISLVFTTTTLGAVMLYPAYNSAATNSFYAWGAQLEAGAFATSYIPTVASQVTRSADVATMTGTNFSDWYNASEGAISTTLQSLPNSSGTASRVVCINDATANNSLISAWVPSTTTMRSRLVVGGATQFQFQATVAATDQNNICTAYKVDDFAASFNAATVLTDTAGSLWAPTQLAISGDATGASFTYNGHIKKILYWPQRLTNAEVQSFSKG